MKDLPRFIRLDDVRINVDEIVSYGLAEDEDGDEFLYVETKTSEDIFECYADEAGFDLEQKFDELDELFLIEKQHVDFQKS